MIIVLELLVRPKRQAVFFSSGYSRTLNRGDQNPMSFFLGGVLGVGGWGGSWLALLSGSLLFSLGS
jgi:hypothetical protein